ncbi:MAG: hypothetical protein ACI9W4_002099 [Rhodothermales bacterium]|jgi:hypothetical protein
MRDQPKYPVKPAKDQDSIVYFAYGSNMSTARLRGRTPSALPLARASLQGWELAINKRGLDGTGKCNIVPVVGAAVHGVLFQLRKEELADLDRAEDGRRGGYRRVPILPEIDGNPIPADTYIASAGFIDNSLHPSSEYKQFVVEGAEEHGLPTAYQDRLRNMKTSPDAA